MPRRKDAIRSSAPYLAFTSSTPCAGIRPGNPAGAPGKGTQSERAQHHVGEDVQMRKNLTFGRQLFAKQVLILLQGATGTGKEAFAKALHHSGLWFDKAFVTVNCG